MALGAIEVAAVIERLVSQPGVTEIRGSPPIRRMTLTTIHGGIEVPRVLAGGIGAVVARRAGPKHLVVVHSGHWFPDSCVVAIFADIRRLYVEWAFAGCVRTVVAARAVVNNTDVVKVRRNPCHGRMTIITIIAAGDVSWVFAGCCYAVMA